ncbi:MAG: mannosyltransferase [Solirubrobacteraceae bacterium]|nr:mannosyltransferase [Solirubrobacteraceae bacterium]
MARSERLALTGIVVAAAALRLFHIGQQSFWLDESYTVDLVQRSFGHMLDGVARTESTPPLFYVLAWAWAKLFGHGEAGLRSLSALFGTLTVPVAWRAGRELFSPAAGLIAAALVAVNPFFVWYSQEARSYALLVLMAALSVLFLARALRNPAPRALALWALSAALALLTHYFAAFLLVPEAIWLLWSARRRAAWAAVGGVGAVALALIPLAVHQRDLGHTSFIAGLSLRSRVTDMPKKLVTGELGTPTPLIGPVAGLIALAAIGYAVYRWRTPAAGLVGIAVAAGVVPLVLAVLGADYLLPRNEIALYLPLVLAVAAGLGAAGRLGIAGAAAICAVAITVNLEVTSDAKLQRDDWRGAARALGSAPEPRAIVVTPDYESKPLRLYARRLEPIPPQGTDVTQVVTVANGRPPQAAPAPQGFTEFSRTTTPSYVLVRYHAPAAIHLPPSTGGLIDKGTQP